MIQGVIGKSSFIVGAKKVGYSIFEPIGMVREGKNKVIFIICKSFWFEKHFQLLFFILHEESSGHPCHPQQPRQGANAQHIRQVPGKSSTEELPAFHALVHHVFCHQVSQFKIKFMFYKQLNIFLILVGIWAI